MRRIERRRLGTLTAPAVGFGAMVLSPGLYGTVEETQASRALLHAIDVGSSFVDTSDGYGIDGHNERLIGATLGARRGEVLISTKFGYRVPPGATRHHVELPYGTLDLNAEPKYVRGYALDSLARLQTDYIDVYSPHFPDPCVPIEETVGAIAELVAEGLVRHIGLSNVTAEQLERAVAVEPISAVQCEWSLWTSPDPALLAAAHRHGVGIVAWAPLGGGFLGGDMAVLDPADLRSRFPRLTGSNLSTNNDRYAPLRAVAETLDLTPSGLALAWLLHQHPTVVPIPGSRTPLHITANAQAATVVLTRDELAMVDEARQSFDPVGGSTIHVPSASTP
jgi:aryl-alcohol dehydrogenase-like predicted oxidoreductase